ncbi:BspA family leucine-rich repeat surface protein [Hallella bergensis]|uniref:BspA family leucine-rich repeat surface protein n=1 Tax=Hallella bergensis TaxID=242750 RepID=UPI003990AEC2
MRNYLLSLFVALLGVMGSLPVAAQEAYAVLTPDSTLTFYYDSQRTTRQNYERIYDMPKPGLYPAWAGDYNKPQKNVMHVVFDASFSGYRPTSTHWWFKWCIKLQDIKGIRNLNTEKVTDMSGMFRDCRALTSLDVSNFNTQSVTDMEDMFSDCKALASLDVSNFNTKNVTNMSFLFSDCEALTSLDLSNFNTKNVTNMRGMFHGCKALISLDVSNFNTQNVTDMNGMFHGCKALISLDVSNFNTQNVTDMSGMFSGCKALTSLDVSKFNTQNVTDMSGMFHGCSALTSLDLSNFNTQNVTNMGIMFFGCKALTSIDLSNFNTQNVTGMSLMFYGCTSLTTIYCNSNWKVGQNVDGQHMFYDCRQLKGTNTAFDENKTGIEMANPTTGYFTSKTTGIDNVKTADRAGYGKAYDLSGSRVNESYKGIVIKNGKKYIQK